MLSFFVVVVVVFCWHFLKFYSYDLYSQYVALFLVFVFLLLLLFVVVVFLLEVIYLVTLSSCC